MLRDAAERIDGLLELAGCIVRGIAFDEARARAALASGDVEATLRMERRVLDGEALRDAHHAEAGAGGQAGADAGAGANGARERLGAERYRTYGSAAPEEVRRTAEALLAALERDPVETTKV